MLFHTPEFLFGFLPLTVLAFFMLSRVSNRAAIAWLLVASVGFYAWWDYRFLGVLGGSIAFNFLMGEQIRRREGKARTATLSVAVIGNLLALGVAKYATFAAETVNWLAGAAVVPVPHVELPLGISFFTFTQIAYLVDVHRRKAKEPDFVAYGLFVTFFPHLIAGPILHHAEMMPQFRRPDLGRIDLGKLQYAAALFLVGLFKKLVLADAFSQWVGPAFDVAPQLSFVEAWTASLAYTFQLYFDFSGYSDMAIALGLLMNIRLPENFNSPYRATNIQDFWNRWHMTLSRFLRDYVYIPLGGNRRGTANTLLNLFLVFLIGGLWHGAGWTFVAWGAMHGAGMVAHRIWQNAGLRMPAFAGGVVTFLFVNAAWVLFRAENWDAAVKVYRGMAGLSGMALPGQVLDLVPPLEHWFDRVGTLAYTGGGSIMGLAEMSLLLATAIGIMLVKTNSHHLRGVRLYATCALIGPFVFQALAFKQSASPFLYFRF